MHRAELYVTIIYPTTLKNEWSCQISDSRPSSTLLQWHVHTTERPRHKHRLLLLQVWQEQQTRRSQDEPGPNSENGTNDIQPESEWPIPISGESQSDLSGVESYIEGGASGLVT